jgi:glycosyltransferase involved in cell wall biosynthesis
VDALSAALADRGHEVAVATLTHSGVARNPKVQVFPVSAAATRLLPHVDPERPFHPPLPDPKASADLAHIIDRFRPSVIHGHSWLTVSLPHRRHVPTVLTAHDYGLVCQLRTLLKTDGELCDGPSSACVRCGAVRYGLSKSAALSLATPLGRRWLRLDAAIAVSRSVQEPLQRALRVDVDVIPNFIPDVEEPLLAPLRGIPAGPYVMFAGDPSPHKGLQVLLACWQRSDRPTAPLVLAVTKDVTDDLPSGVHVVHLRREQMHTAWARAAVAVVPSIWADPFPTVALEAMAAGTPVVASELGGLRDMMTDGLHGFHVPPGSAAALRDRITQLLDDEPLRERLGESARHHVQQFRASAVVPQIEEAYARAIAHAKNAPHRFSRTRPG